MIGRGVIIRICHAISQCKAQDAKHICLATRRARLGDKNAKDDSYPYWLSPDCRVGNADGRCRPISSFSQGRPRAGDDERAIPRFQCRLAGSAAGLVALQQRRPFGAGRTLIAHPSLASKGRPHLAVGLFEFALVTELERIDRVALLQRMLPGRNSPGTFGGQPGRLLRAPLFSHTPP